MKYLAIVFALFLVSGLIFSLGSCQKETQCKAVVRCITDSSGAPVANAFIEVYAPVKGGPTGTTTFTGDVKASDNTDGSGEARFTFKLPAIFDVKATLTSGAITYTGASSIKLEEGKTVDATVKITRSK